MTCNRMWDPMWCFGFTNNLKRTLRRCVGSPEVARTSSCFFRFETYIRDESAINEHLATFLPILTMTFNALLSGFIKLTFSVFLLFCFLLYEVRGRQGEKILYVLFRIF